MTETKTPPSLSEAHISWGLPLLAKLDLPVLVGVFDRFSRLKGEREALEAAGTSEAAVAEIIRGKKVEMVAEVIQSLKGIGDSRVTRDLILVCTSTGEQLFDYETDKTAHQAALKRVAVSDPREAVLAVVAFFEASGFSGTSTRASSRVELTRKDPEANAEAAASEGSPSAD